MIKVVSFKICPFVQRILALLAVKEVPYKLEYISLQNKPQWFLDISPNGQVPVLIAENGMVLFESDAIAEYIDEIFPKLEADISPEQRAIDRAWSYQANQNYLIQDSAQRSPDKETLEERAAKFNTALAKAEKVLGDGPYFKGKTLSNVDIVWLPLLHRAAIIESHTGYDFLADYPKVKAWQSAIIETGIPAKSVAEDFEEVFTGFYLSEETYLGNDKKKCEEKCLDAPGDPCNYG